MSIYRELTGEFNAGQVRAVVASGQAVVLHRLAVTSKDGDWILREDDDSLAVVLGVLERRGARYRFGAPLDCRWMRGGWSAHLEFREGRMRIRTDFFTRPPRISTAALAEIWRTAVGDVPFVGLTDLAELKKTDRERDWPIIGELARRMSDPRDQLLYSRSARDLVVLSAQHPELCQSLRPRRPLLAHLSGAAGPALIEALEAALDAERREQMRANTARLDGFARAATAWAAAWPQVEAEVAGLPLSVAHRIVVERAETVLPFSDGSEAIAGRTAR